MFVDHDFLSAGQIPPVVIVGSGPAGITLARTLDRQGVGSLTIEAGGLEFDPDSQEIYQGETVGDEYFDLDVTRLRYFGGSSNHWSGRCRTLDAHDFERKSYMPHSGWPIGRPDLDPMLAEAKEILGLIGPSVRADGTITEERPLNDDLAEVSFAFSQSADGSELAVRFGEAYHDLYQHSGRTHALLNMSVEAVLAEAGRAKALRLRAPSGEVVEIAPTLIVLCCGGIETSRLLLWSNEVSPDRVVADPATLGRYWMEHPEQNVGRSYIIEPFNRFTDPWFDFYVAPSPAAMEKYEIANAYILLNNQVAEGAAEDMIKDRLCASPNRANTARRLGFEIDCAEAVRAIWEQAPDPANRVALSETARDRFGVPRSELHWRKSEADYRTPKIVLELLGRYLVENRLGVLRAARHTIEKTGYAPNEWPGGNHHMGGARMATSPREGVVDRDLKVFGASNLYVLGSSVFPTGGAANPTLTIVQLALRLGAHLGRNVS